MLNAMGTGAPRLLCAEIGSLPGGTMTIGGAGSLKLIHQALTRPGASGGSEIDIVDIARNPRRFHVCPRDSMVFIGAECRAHVVPTPAQDPAR